MSLCFSDRSSQFASEASDSEENTGGEEDTDEDYRNFEEDFGAGAYTDPESENSDSSDGQVPESDNTDLEDLESELRYCPFFRDFYEASKE
jgi:hypothetical protein